MSKPWVLDNIHIRLPNGWTFSVHTRETLRLARVAAWPTASMDTCSWFDFGNGDLDIGVDTWAEIDAFMQQVKDAPPPCQKH